MHRPLFLQLILLLVWQKVYAQSSSLVSFHNFLTWAPYAQIVSLCFSVFPKISSSDFIGSLLLLFWCSLHVSSADFGFMEPEVENNINYEEKYITNSRGLKLFTCSWLPQDREPKALIFICHGYGMECSITMRSTAVRLVKAGYAVYGIDYEGHGKSGGLMAFINSFDDLVDDCSTHFTSISERRENKEKMRYLMGESMGGAVALLLHRKTPEYWDGAVLVAPMCKIADDAKPPSLVINILTKLTNVIPTWKIIPSPSIIDLAFKVPEVREQVKANKYCYKGRPRLKTGYECLRISMELEKRLNEVSLPFIVLHGEEDKVTDKSVSKQLYDSALSSDKTFKLYPGMWHGLLYGETSENIEIVFNDILGWLDKRTSLGNSRLERELKEENDAHPTDT